MLKKNAFIVFVLAFAMTALLVACGGSAATPTEPPATVPPTQSLSVPTEALATVPVETVAPLSTPTTQAAASISFARDVLPILQANCSNCHGGSTSSGGFSINTYQDVMAGGNTGSVVLPGDGQNSYLIQLLQKGTMPRRASKLPDAQIQIIMDWINAGAPDN